MTDYIISQIRMYVPLSVGVVIAFLASHGMNLHISDARVEAVVTVLTGLFTALYYSMVRLLEKYVSPKFGWLLGYAQSPSYAVAPKQPVVAPSTSAPVGA